MKEKPKLPFIILEVTSKCNLNCRYCYNIWKRPGQVDHSSDSYKKARKLLKKLFSIAEIDQLTFTGGEPLISERFTELVLFSRLKKKGVSVISNGNSGNKELYKTLINLGVGLFEFPILSYNPEVHDFLTTVKGSWKKSLDSVKQVLALNGNVVGVIVITKVNFNHIDKTLKLIKDTGVRRIMLNRYNIGGNGIEQLEKLVTTQKELNYAFELANQTAVNEHLILTSNVCTPLCYVNPNDYKNIEFTSCSSSIYNKPLTIDLDGNMRICNHSPIIIGNIYNDHIKEILNSPYLKQWTDIVPEYCESCNVFEKCLGGCRAASEQMGFDLKMADPILNYK